jgi:cob(I)alamin adenosyltransferase
MHVARCVCRRAERCCVNLKENSNEVNPLIIKYLNRLSDYLFMLARYTSMKNNAAEIIWKARV